MAGSGRKTFSPGDVLTSSDVQNYLMDQSVMVFAGTAARASAIPSPSAGMVAYSTATALQVYNGSAWVDLSTGYGVATGGTSSSITVGGVNYTLLTFTATGTLTNTKAGLFDILIYGAGGGGGKGDVTGYGGGGGGAGGYTVQTVYLSANQTITIGSGGAGATSNGAAGTRGSFTNIGAPLISILGGMGGAGTGNVNTGGIGACGGGGGLDPTAGVGFFTTLTTTYGFNGGTGFGGTQFTTAGAGGGGTTAVGANAVSTVGGAGGAGYDVGAFISGSTFKGGGGGGGGQVTGGAGGSSVGGAGGTAAGTNAAANSASGGGGAFGGNTGGNGGSGIVYVRFKV